MSVHLRLDRDTSVHLRLDRDTSVHLRLDRDTSVHLHRAVTQRRPALTVRFLTKRYIGEYDHHGDQPPYKYELMVDGEPVLFELLDTCPKTAGEMPSTKTLDWADGFLLVYSITDRDSFSYIKRLRSHMAQWRREGGPAAAATPMVLVGNKGDMIHLRQVGNEEGV
ncbi:ras-related and estrogen-regulated growth inhibitor-like protein [Pollicipes pollicipes]|uniref:ras-related and estrogen-regulated growth inhibitor-like protein n=1 Tax=Pollicipes pollicipes TaxID=41117 RepID=UPI001884FBBB|nr:ras-related and estrogen-regulated growth inhibitor-like protein [Pollicipes pollicipes]